jgi:hypothetical protein
LPAGCGTRSPTRPTAVVPPGPVARLPSRVPRRRRPRGPAPRCRPLARWPPRLRRPRPPRRPSPPRHRHRQRRRPRPPGRPARPPACVPAPGRACPHRRSGRSVPSSSPRPPRRHPPPRRPRPLPRRPQPSRRVRSSNSRRSSSRPVRPPRQRRLVSSPVPWCPRGARHPSPVRAPRVPVTTRSVSAVAARVPLRRPRVVPVPAANVRRVQVGTVPRPVARVATGRHPVPVTAVRGPTPAACRRGPTRA